MTSTQVDVECRPCQWSSQGEPWYYLTGAPAQVACVDHATDYVKGSGTSRGQFQAHVVKGNRPSPGTFKLTPKLWRRR